MKHGLAFLCFLGTFLCTLARCTVSATEFQLQGDYLIGGLFNIHRASDPGYYDRPEAIDCSSKPFLVSNYRRFQLMRFSVEEINNSTNLLPNVSLGYEIFDHCSDTHNFPDILNLISVNNSIQPWGEPHRNLFKMSKAIAVVGPFTSTEALTVAPFFMVDLIPMVNYGCSTSVFSKKAKYPSFLRTVHPNKHIIEVIISIVQHFNWRWVAFLNSDNDFGTDGQELFRNMIKDTEICLAYTKGLGDSTNYAKMFKNIEAQKIHIIIVFAPEMTAEELIDSAIQLNITNKVWIAGDAWSLNPQLLKKEGIKNIGTVLGVSQPVVTIPGFGDFIYASKRQTHCENAEQQMFCNQLCNCSDQSAQDVIDADPSFSFPVYSAVYAIAHALHNVLQCETGRCNGNITVYPYMNELFISTEGTSPHPQRLHVAPPFFYSSPKNWPFAFCMCYHKIRVSYTPGRGEKDKVLAELKKSNFTLLNQSIQFDVHGDPRFGSYSIVFWNDSGDAEKVGFYTFLPSVNFFINNSQIQWYTKGEVPISLCSPECPEGYSKNQDGIHKCCFTCEICSNGTYINSTEDAYNCINCKETEWSTPGSTSCNPRMVDYIPFTDFGAVLIMVGASALVGLTLAMSVLFAINYSTPVVRSAGGPMCFLILGCHSLCSLCVFFYFDKPTISFCILRILPFLLFYTVCLACFVVRSFQIVCIFKIAAKFPKLHSWWMKYHGQWLVITGAFVTQALLLVVSYAFDTPKPYNETVWYEDKIILSCNINIIESSAPMVLILSLCSLCFIFSYMGKDLPKNYNEAKAITFCLLLLILTWIIFATIYMLYRDKYIQTLNALAVLSSLYSFLLWYFLPKCYIIIFQPHKNTQQYFQGLIQSYTKTISQ